MATLEDVRLASQDITLPNAGTNNKIDLTTALKDNGFDKGQKITAQNFNYWANAVYDWIVDLDARTTAALQLETVYPVGSLYFNSSNSTNPATLLGIGTWVRAGQGRVLIGEGTGTDANSVQRTFNIGDEGGEYVHTLSTDEMPSHSHPLKLTKHVTGDDATSGVNDAQILTATRNRTTENVFPAASGDNVGGSQAHNNIQPYLTVYIWERTA